MYIVQVETPAESKQSWGYYHLVEAMPDDHAFWNLSDLTCPLLKE